MKKILVTGASGMLGATLVRLWNKKYRVYATARDDFRSKPTINFKRFDLATTDYRVLSNWVKPDVIIHCAAITSHEYCQSHPKEAMLVNSKSVIKFIEAFPKTKLIYISTDAVFPLNTHLAKETTKTCPVTIYGKSKARGEKYMLALARNGCIVRTTIVGKNINLKKQSFTDWIINSLRIETKIMLYVDTIFTPISIWHLANELEWIFNNKVPKILHVAGREIISKYDFGSRLSKELKLDFRLITKGELSKNRIIQRSNDQSLDVSFYQSISSRRLPDSKDTINVLAKHFKV